MKNGFSGYENLGEIENINKELQSNNGSPSLIKYPTTLSSVPKQSLQASKSHIQDETS